MRQSICSAIASHLAWAKAFRNAIETKSISDSVAASGYDDLCSFGKWLYSLDDEIKHRQGYRRVKDLHYRFHADAGEVVRLMQNSDFSGARTHMEGDFASTSGQLVLALQDWLDTETEID